MTSLRKLKRKAILGSAALLTAITFSITGCSHHSAALDGVKHCIEDKDSSKYCSSPTPTPKATADTSFVTGDVVGKMQDGKPDIITDNHGSYQKVELNPNSKLLKTVDPATINANVADGGWTKEQLLSGQQFITKFVGSESIDSTALDGGMDTFKTWVANNSSKYYDTEYKDELLKADLTQSGLVNNTAGSKESNIPLIYTRDGKPRMTSAAIDITDIQDYVNPAAPDVHYLLYAGKFDVNYRIDNSELIKAAEAKGYTKADVVKDLPQVADEKKKTVVHGTMNFKLYTRQLGDNEWKISGWANPFKNDAVDKVSK